ncbi:MAG TPA: hypothetical protein VOA80_13420 [Thermoanaerobaculia bacterium]|nr:hypothetical protein [Thermoanaerobaculia bacterium]
MIMGSPTLALFYLSSLAGFVMVAGGVWLIYKEKLYIDKESREITEIEIPMFGKFRTNVPALMLFALGFVPLIFPMWRLSRELDKVHLLGSVEGAVMGNPVQVLAVAGTETLRNAREFELILPKDVAQSSYTLIYIQGSAIFEDHVQLKEEMDGKVHAPSHLVHPLPDPVKYAPNLPAVSPDFGSH